MRRRSHMALSLGLALTVFLTSLGLTVSAHAPSTPVPDNDYFIIYQGENGDTVCREANASEIRELEKINPKGLRQINHTEEKSTGLTAEQADNDTTHLTIILRATANLDSPTGNAPAAKAAFVRAAAAWENLITSPVTIYLDADYGPDNFGQSWPTGVLGSTSSPSLNSVSYSVVRNNLIAGADTPAKLGVYNALPSNSVPTDSGTATTVSVSASIGRAIGLLNPTAQSSDNAARIGFNSNSNFDFDRTNGTTGIDFESVATHEIGHALGFTSRAGAGGSTPAMWDLYRFRTGTTLGTFATAQRVLTIGGSPDPLQFYFVPGDSEVGLSNGGPSGASTSGADGNQSSHWKQANLNGGYIGIMDPRIPNGSIRPITDVDVRALNIFGYNSNAVPPPTPPANDNFAAAQVITGCSGSVTGTNVGATREGNEPIHSPDNVSSNHSVWYQWQAPVTTNVTITTAGSGFDTVLGVYTGNAVGSLSSLGKADDNNANDKTSSVAFTATSGTTYRIAVDGYNNGGLGGDVGPITLNWSVSSCSGAVPIQLILDQTGPAADQASALDSILMVRDPFFVVNSANVFNPGADPNTRVVVFVADLQVPAGVPASSVTINLIDSNNQTFNVAAQDFRAVPNQALTQITFRLPDNLSVGTCKIKVVTQNQVSNTATIRIRN